MLNYIFKYLQGLTTDRFSFIPLNLPRPEVILSTGTKFDSYVTQLRSQEVKKVDLSNLDMENGTKTITWILTESLPTLKNKGNFILLNPKKIEAYVEICKILNPSPQIVLFSQSLRKMYLPLVKSGIMLLPYFQFSKKEIYFLWEQLSFPRIGYLDNIFTLPRYEFGENGLGLWPIDREKKLQQSYLINDFLARKKKLSLLNESSKLFSATIPTIQKNQKNTDLKKKIPSFCLTFDVEKYTGTVYGLKRILKVLDNFEIKATFFITGEIMALYPDKVDEIDNKDHEISLHGLYHEQFSGFSMQKQRKLLQKTIRIAQNWNESPNFRAPGYYSDENTHSLLAEFGIACDAPYFHNVDSFTVPTVIQTDKGKIIFLPTKFETFGREGTYNNLSFNSFTKLRIKPLINTAHVEGGVVTGLFHPFRDGSKINIKLFEKLIRYLKEKEFPFYTVQEIVNQHRYLLNNDTKRLGIIINDNYRDSYFKKMGKSSRFLLIPYDFNWISILKSRNFNKNTVLVHSSHLNSVKDHISAILRSNHYSRNLFTRTSYLKHLAFKAKLALISELEA